jgi:integrase
MVSRKADGVSDIVLRKTMILAKQILNAGVEEGLIATNPFGPVKLPQQQAREMRFLTPEQLNDLLEAMTPHYRCMVLTAAVLGLRFGEIAGLRPEDLDLLHGQVRVTGQLAEWHGKPQRVDPKTDASIRTVAIPDVLKAELEDQLSQRSSTEYLFTSRSGEPIRKSNFNRRHWQPALRTAGLERFVFHELRHTAVAFAIDAGAHPRAIQARLGHASITTTLDVYGHRMPGLDDRLAEAFDARLRETLAPLQRPRAQNEGP